MVQGSYTIFDDNKSLKMKKTKNRIFCFRTLIITRKSLIRASLNGSFKPDATLLQPGGEEAGESHAHRWPMSADLFARLTRSLNRNQITPASVGFSVTQTLQSNDA